jgi:hypothetical protein
LYCLSLNQRGAEGLSLHCVVEGILCADTSQPQSGACKRKTLGVEVLTTSVPGYLSGGRTHST